jgi:hypothetical protein
MIRSSVRKLLYTGHTFCRLVLGLEGAELLFIFSVVWADSPGRPYRSYPSCPGGEDSTGKTPQLGGGVVHVDRDHGFLSKRAKTPRAGR